MFYCYAHGKWKVVDSIKEGKTVMVEPLTSPFVSCDYVYANLDTVCSNKVSMQITVHPGKESGE